MVKHTKNKRGFTIIEVVLVLAIAGLIFLMVFVALPTLQRNQRNTERKELASRVASAIIEYQKHNGGKLPLTATTSSGTGKFDTNFIPRYVDSECKYAGLHSASIAGDVKIHTYKDCGAQFTDPDGSIYNFVANDKLSTKGSTLTIYPDRTLQVAGHSIFMMIGTKCGKLEWQHDPTGRPNDFALMVALEGSGNYYCVDNS